MKLSVGRLYHTCKNSLGTFKANRCRVYLDRGSCCFDVLHSRTQHGSVFCFQPSLPTLETPDPSFCVFRTSKAIDPCLQASQKPWTDGCGGERVCREVLVVLAVSAVATPWGEGLPQPPKILRGIIYELEPLPTIENVGSTKQPENELLQNTYAVCLSVRKYVEGKKEHINTRTEKLAGLVPIKLISRI